MTDTVPRSGFDVDTDHLATVLRDIADGMDSGDLRIMGVESDHTAGPEDPSEVTLAVTYDIPRGAEHLAHPIVYDTDDEAGTAPGEQLREELRGTNHDH